MVSGYVSNVNVGTFVLYVPVEDAVKLTDLLLPLDGTKALLDGALMVIKFAINVGPSVLVRADVYFLF